MKQGVTFVLVRPRYAGNIGSAARALRNMGLSRLSLVQPEVSPLDSDAKRLAVGAAGLLKKVKIYSTLEAALQEFQFVVGTSRRFGRQRRNFIPLSELPACLPRGQKVGILFGSEEKGLSNQELARCHRVVTIPSNPRFPSINLAQAVMLVAYELKKVAPPTLPSVTLAPLEEVEGMCQQLEATLAEIGFFPHGNPFMVMRTLRGLLGRSGITTREIRVIRGICRQILWYKNERNSG